MVLEMILQNPCLLLALSEDVGLLEKRKNGFLDSLALPACDG